ncbi:MAG: alpha/beta hydrolase, partial [Myxococcota bacterium]
MHHIVRGFQDRGHRVFSADWRGQGHSHRDVDQQVGHIDAFSTYLQDHASVLKAVFPGEKTLLFGHSMGGHNALRQSAVNPSLVAGVIATAPMMNIHLPMPRAAANFLCERIDQLGLTKRPAIGQDNMFEKDLNAGGPVQSQDYCKWRKLMNVLIDDPSLVTGGPTYGWVRAALYSMDAALEHGVPEGIQAPALIVTAGNDNVVKSQCAEEFAQRMPNATTVEIPEAQHDIPQETDAILGKFWRATDAFLREHELSA